MTTFEKCSFATIIIRYALLEKYQVKINTTYRFWVPEIFADGSMYCKYPCVAGYTSVSCIVSTVCEFKDYLKITIQLNK